MNIKNLPTKHARMAAYAAKQHRKQKPPKKMSPKSEPPRSVFRLSLKVLRKAFCLE